MLGRVLIVGAATGAIAVGTLFVAPAAQAKPPEATTECHSEHHIEFYLDGSSSESDRVVCRTVYSNGKIIEKALDSTGRPTEVCIGRKGRIFQDCVDTR